MLAFVLSGGGNRGALQVGALQVLLEAGIKPDLLVGTSIGAVNAAMIASNLSVMGSYELATIWRRVTRQDVYPGHGLTPLWSLFRGYEGLYSNQKWYQWLCQVLPVETFGEVAGCQLRVVATDLWTGGMALFGNDPSMRLVDALMASTAMPPMHAPWRINGRPYIDGGAVADLPIRVALNMGAKTIFSLHIAPLHSGAEHVRDVMGVSNQAVSTLLRCQMTSDLEYARRSRGVRLHEVELQIDFAGQAWDFSRTDEMIGIGRDATRRLLAREGLPAIPLSERLSRATAPLGEHLVKLTTSVGEQVSRTTAPLGEQLSRAAAPILAASTERFTGLWFRPKPGGSGPAGKSL